MRGDLAGLLHALATGAATSIIPQERVAGGLPQRLLWTGRRKGFSVPLTRWLREDLADHDGDTRGVSAGDVRDGSGRRKSSATWGEQPVRSRLAQHAAVAVLVIAMWRSVQGDSLRDDENTGTGRVPRDCHAL